MLFFLQAPKRYQNGEKIRVHSESHEILEIDVYLRLADTRIVHEGVLEQAGGAEQHNITEAAPNELKLDDGR